MPPNCYYKDFDPALISKEEDFANTQKLSRFIRYTDLSYIYSLIRDKNGSFRFSSSIATQKEIKTDNHNKDRKLVGSLIDSLHKAHIKERITIEILKSEQFKNFDYLYEFIKETRSLGIQISIDVLEADIPTSQAPSSSTSTTSRSMDLLYGMYW